MKDEFLIQVPKTADGFWAAIGALQSLGEWRREFLHLTPGGLVYVNIDEKLGQMHGRVKVWEEMGVLYIHVQSVMQLRSRRWDRDAEKYRPLTPHCVLSVVRGFDVSEVRSLTEICGLQVKVDAYNTPKTPPALPAPALWAHAA
jgi:hypothetical protein